MKFTSFINTSLLKNRDTQKGFTLIEILLVVAIIAILAGIVILAVNPNKQLGDTRNAKRRADVNTILNAIHQYNIDNNALPSSITLVSTEICKTSGTCTGLIDLSALTLNEKYLTSIPIDLIPSNNSNGTGYQVMKDVNNRVTVSAPNAEQGETISATR